MLKLRVLPGQTRRRSRRRLAVSRPVSGLTDSCKINDFSVVGNGNAEIVLTQGVLPRQSGVSGPAMSNPRSPAGLSCGVNRVLRTKVLFRVQLERMYPECVPGSLAEASGHPPFGDTRRWSDQSQRRFEAVGHL